jgi:hypothetical protein
MDEEPQAKRARLCEEALEKQTAEYKCPITQELMDDPVVAADGRLYERKELETWLATHTTSPVTNEEMARGPLVSCPPVRNAIEALVASGTLDATDESSWQLRRGERLEARGDDEAAAACYERASALGDSVGKYRVAMRLLREAADDGYEEAAERLSPSVPPWSLEDFTGQYWGTDAPHQTLMVRHGYGMDFNMVNYDGLNGAILRITIDDPFADDGIHLRQLEIEESNEREPYYLDQEESNPSRLVWKHKHNAIPRCIWWMKLCGPGVKPGLTCPCRVFR